MVSSDWIVPDKNIQSHSIFAFTNIREALIENCTFLYNQKFKVVTLLNVERRPFSNTFFLTNLTFNELIVTNNLGNHIDKGIRSLFSFYSPIKPLNLIFTNSLFENNVIGKIFQKLFFSTYFHRSKYF